MNQTEIPHGRQQPIQDEGLEMGPARSDDLPFSPMLGCLIALLVGLAGAFVVFQLVRLVYFGELRFGGPALAPNRLWLVREADNAGLFLSNSRVISGAMNEQEVCIRTSIRSVQWRHDESQQVAGYCLCYMKAAGSWQQQGSCPQDGDE